MKLTFDYKITLFFSCVLAVLSIISVCLLGFGGDTQNNRTMVVAYLPYGTDYEWVDTDQLADDLYKVLGKKCEIGFSSNFLDGFTNLIATVPSIIEVDEDSFLNLLSENYSELGIEAISVYKLRADNNNSVLLNSLIVLIAFMVIFALFGFIVFKDKAYVRSVETVTALSGIISTGFLSVARVPSGANITASVVISCVTSILCTCWIIGNLLVINKATKNKKSQVAAEKAKTLGLSITVETFITAIIILTGIGVASIICGESKIAYTALSVSLPMIISGILSQLLGVDLYNIN